MPDAVDTVVCAPDDGWRYHPKHVEQFPEINKLCNVAYCWIYISETMQRCNHINVMTIRYDVIFSFISQDALINYLRIFLFLCFLVFFSYVPCLLSFVICVFYVVLLLLLAIWLLTRRDYKHELNCNKLNYCHFF